MKAPSFRRLTWRAVRQWHPRLMKLSAPPSSFPLPEDSWEHCRKLARMAERAQVRGWHLAAGKLKVQFQAAVERLYLRLKDLKRQFATPPESIPLSPAALYWELCGLEDEFPGLRYDFQQGSLTVQTEAIVLGDVDLGPFEIVLNWPDLDRSQAYEVVACEPRPAASEADIVHPHVQRNQLCEGEGRPLIERALHQGRLADFFLIVAQILKTYNPDSAYVQLGEWEGMPCVDCGLLTTEDERSHCRESGEALCGDCVSECRDCEETFSVSYLVRCTCCEESFCARCTQTCTECRQVCCQACHQQGTCEECQQYVASKTSGRSRRTEVSADVPPSPAPAHF